MRRSVAIEQQRIWPRARALEIQTGRWWQSATGRESLRRHPEAEESGAGKLRSVGRGRRRDHLFFEDVHDGGGIKARERRGKWRAAAGGRRSSVDMR